MRLATRTRRTVRVRDTGSRTDSIGSLPACADRLQAIRMLGNDACEDGRVSGGTAGDLDRLGQGAGHKDGVRCTGTQRDHYRDQAAFKPSHLDSSHVDSVRSVAVRLLCVNQADRSGYWGMRMRVVSDVTPLPSTTPASSAVACPTSFSVAS